MTDLARLETERLLNSPNREHIVARFDTAYENLVAAARMVKNDGPLGAAIKQALLALDSVSESIEILQ